MILDEIELISSRGSGRFTGSGGSPRLKWTVDNTPERFTLTLRAEEETVLQTVRARFSFAFEKGDLLYLNGYQSWTDSRERGRSPWCGATPSTATATTALSAMTTGRAGSTASLTAMSAGGTS